MKMKKLISLLLIAVLAVTSVIALSACGSKKDEAPKTLEEFFDNDEDAKKDLDEIAKGMSGEVASGSVEVVENDIALTLKLNDTFESDYLTDMKSKFESAIESQKSTISEQIKSIEEKSGISGVSMTITVQNGDGTEIVSESLTSAE